MTRASSIIVQRAVVLAAGNGDRFKNGTQRSKLLTPILGQPLILRTLSTAAAAGISSFEIVLGYQADAVRAVVERGLPSRHDCALQLQPRLATRERCVCSCSAQADGGIGVLRC